MSSKYQGRLSKEEILEAFEYDPLTGIFIRIKCYHKRFIGLPAGYADSNGYTRLNYNNKETSAQLAAFVFMTGDFPKNGYADHIDRDTFNNKWENLRDANSTISVLNRNDRHAMGTKPSPVTKGKWLASIGYKGKKGVHIGTFDTKELAQEAYRNKRAELIKREENLLNDNN